MASLLVFSLRTLFVVLGCAMVATLIYTISVDGLPFRKDVLTPWMTTTLIDYYINVLPLAAWVSYKEANWLTASIWVVLFVCLGSITACMYVTIQLFQLSADKSMHDLMYHLLLPHQNKNGMVSKWKSLQLVTAIIVCSALGCLMFGTLVYTIFTDGSPFNKDLLTPWMIATLIDFYINVVALSVWVAYKEPSWVRAFFWILGLVCFGSIATCGYMALQFFQLSPYDPIYLVLLNRQQRAESRYDRMSG
ncbi:hypothetical protein Nepgr_023234 [Nepenthes gracilis]|uniref:Uncharacterized protein n=1 Tax=Nepenthes gracilis TaxID=150966 RepID=A0AAD3T3G2_NEPGR|nr:hypothetical protein Nepgr_023234 [Nepenthes gracilis]